MTWGMHDRVLKTAADARVLENQGGVHKIHRRGPHYLHGEIHTVQFKANFYTMMSEVVRFQWVTVLKTAFDPLILLNIIAGPMRVGRITVPPAPMRR